MKCGNILLRKCDLELNMTATEVTESTERGLGGGKDISVYSVAESYKKQIWFSIITEKAQTIIITTGRDDINLRIRIMDILIS